MSSVRELPAVRWLLAYVFEDLGLLDFLGFLVALHSPSLLSIGILFPLHLSFIKFLKQYLLFHIFLK